MVHRSADLQDQLVRTALDSMDSQRTTQNKGMEVLMAATTASLDAMAAMTPEGEATVENIQEAMHDQFEAATAVNDQLWEAMERAARENADAMQELEQSYLSMFDESVDAWLDATTRMEEQTASAADAMRVR